MLSADFIEPASEYPTSIPIDPDPPFPGLDPALRCFRARCLVHGALHALRLSIRHNARAAVANGTAPATWVASELRLGAVAAREAQNSLQDALDMLQTDIPPHPGAAPGCHDLPAIGMPDGQAEFQEWVRGIHWRVFRCWEKPEKLTPLEAPTVDGLTIYGAEANNVRFYGAWATRYRAFIGWMRTSPHLSAEDPDGVHAIGEVLGRSIFTGMVTMEEAKAVEGFMKALKEAAGDLGVEG
jgi:hypothetical protein